MNKGYWIALYKKINNTDSLGNYAKKATETILKYGGNPIVRGGKYNILEGEDFFRTVVWEFPSYKIALECYNSKEYQEAWKLAKSTTERNFQVVEGFSTE